MFNLFKKKEKTQPAVPPIVAIRDTLFGDMPISQWAKDLNATEEPWASFAQARKCLEAGDQASAISVLQTITEMPVLEPRHYLQAWHFLRQMGVNPPADKAKLVYGVIVETGYPLGIELLAVYANFTIRYFPYNGGGYIWERPDRSLDDEVQALFRGAQAVANQIGPWEGERPGPPQTHHMRLNMLTPIGNHFGYGEIQTLNSEAMGKAILDPARQLIAKLTSKAKK
jgi:hypothetical protein